MIKLKINNETSRLKIVVVGISESFGGVPKLEDCYDPKSKECVLNGTFPKEQDLKIQIEHFVNTLKKYDVNVLRPKNFNDINQIFVRDIFFVIEDKLFIPNIISERSKEQCAIEGLISKIETTNIFNMPDECRVEGGDVILYNDYLFIGYSDAMDFNKFTVARTNKKSVDFLKDIFPKKKIRAFELNKSDTNPKKNALHLDCCFQPIGSNMAIIHKNSFKNASDVLFLENLFGISNLIEVDDNEMYDMNCNVFSVSENIIISSTTFSRLNKELQKKGFVVEEVMYNEVAKMEGLFRCTTIPLDRE